MGSMAHALLPDPKSLALDNIAVQEGIITFYIHTTTAMVACPDCGCCSERVHSRYQRTLQDLPWQGNAVRFLLTVRRFLVRDNQRCCWRIPQGLQHVT
jgi:transposase